MTMTTLRLSPVTVRPRTTSCSFLRLKSPALRVSFLRGPSGRCRGGGVVCSMQDVTAGSYALALADLANSTSTLESTMSDIEKVENVFSDPAVISFFDNPTIAVEKKQDVVEEIIKSSKLQSHTANFLRVVLDQERTSLLPDIVQEFERFFNKFTDTEVAVVSSVVRLESQDLAQIAQAVQRLTSAKNVRIKSVIEPSLVAGFTIRCGEGGSKLIDMSVKKQLEEIVASAELPDFSFPL